GIPVGGAAVRKNDNLEVARRGAARELATPPRRRPPRLASGRCVISTTGQDKRKAAECEKQRSTAHDGGPRRETKGTGTSQHTGDAQDASIVCIDALPRPLSSFRRRALRSQGGLGSRVAMLLRLPNCSVVLITSPS